MLSDLLIIELASVLAGPSVGQFFAELGATVLKVENPRTGGDVTRRWLLPAEAAPYEARRQASEETEEGREAEGEKGTEGTTQTPDDRPAYFACCNHGKQSVALDLTTEGGRTVLHDLARAADVVVASYRPGTAEALGADYATLAALNSGLVYGHVTGYGAEAARAGYDAVIQAEAGFTFINGPADGPPTKLPVALMDVLAAHQLKEALLVALLRRTRTGEGAYVPVSLFQSAVSGLANQATSWTAAGQLPLRMGSAHPQIAPYGTPYRTRGGPQVVLAVGTDRQFAALCDVLGLSALPQNPHFATNAARVQHRAALERVLAARLAQMDADALLADLRARHVPAGPIRTVAQVFAQPAAEAMTLRPPEGPAGLRQCAFPPPGPDAAPTLSPAPRYAEHTAAVLRERLGRSAAAVEALAEAGAVEVRGNAG
jgi:crotonobetainyl-CoA:carnitine CoA-transferase CaiB-like acyl-CoA transferase